MRNEYDFSKSVPNPYLDKLEEQVTIQLEEQVANYFRQLSVESGISYQNVISLYLKDCMQTQCKLSLQWIDEQRMGCDLIHNGITSITSIIVKLRLVILLSRLLKIWRLM